MKTIREIMASVAKPWVLYFLVITVLSILVWQWGQGVSVFGVFPFATYLSRLLIIAVLFAVFAFKYLKVKEPVAAAMLPSPALSENATVFDKFELCLSMVFKHLKKNRKRLPWHIVVGYRDSGKSELMKCSGLEFPFLEEMQLAASLSAADVQIYINAQGIFVDVPGTVLEDRTGKQWEKLVRSLNKYDIKTNLASLIVVVSLSELLKNNEEEKQRVYFINQCLGKMQRSLSLIIPIYCVMTKADSVVGFNECFTGLTEKEKAQAWGIAFDKTVEFKNDFVSAYEAWVKSLNQKVRALLQRENNRDHVSLMAGFPLQMASLKPLLLKQMERLFFNPLFKEKFDLCGMYFTSTEQNAAPLDYLFENINARYGLAFSPIEPTHTSRTAYFIHDFFEHVLMGNVSQHKTQNPYAKIANALFSGGFVVLFLLSGWLMQTNYQKNIAVLSDIGNQNKILASSPMNAEEKIVQLSALDMAYEQMRPQFEGLSLLGFSQARQVIDVANQQYHLFLMRHYMPLFASVVAEKIKGNQTDVYGLYQALKVYLMLAEPSHRDAEFMANWSERNLAKPWLLRDHDLIHIFAKSPYQITPDMTVVSDARAVLNQYSPAEFAYSELLYKPAVLKQSMLTFDDSTILNFRKVFTGKTLVSVSKFYTPMGFNTVFLKEAPGLIANQMSMDAWVLGRDDRAIFMTGRDGIFQKMQLLYFQDYIAHWEAVGKQLRLTTLSSFPYAVNTLNILAEPSSPLSTIVSSMIKNTTLTNSVVGSSTAVDTYFIPLHQLKSSVGGIQTNLAELAMYLQNINTASNPDEASFNAAKLMMANSSDSPLVRLLQKANNSPEPVKHWLYGIVNDATRLILSGASQWINRAWKDNVYTAYQQTLSNRYPFVSGSVSSVGSADFNNFFGSGGVLDAFTQRYIQPFLSGGDGNLQLQSFSGQTVFLNAGALQLFQQAKQIRQIQFGSDSLKGGIQYTLRAVDMSPSLAEAQLNVGNQRFVYRHDPQQFAAIQWPPADGATSVSLTVIDLKGHRTTISKNGDWALTQFLQSCSLQRTGGTDLRYNCQVNDDYVSYIVHTTSAQNSLVRDSLSGFKVPREILAKENLSPPLSAEPTQG